MSEHIFIDQVLTGFDLLEEDYGVAEFLKKRQSIIKDSALSYILEFMEVSVDTYENLPMHRRGKLDPSLRNILIWRDPREPYSLTYWTLAEFKRLIDLLHAGGVERVMVRTFLTYEGRTGHGRFLRQENNPHVQAFEWRRADEFCRRHPELRDNTHLLNWHQEMRVDPLYRIEQGMTVGNWYKRQLFDFFVDLGVDAVRFGDGSFGGELQHAMEDSQKEFTAIHTDLLTECRQRDIKMLTSLGPYWTWDAWHNTLGINYKDLPHVADWVLTQPAEGWTDKYGMNHVHTGEYFNAGCGNIHALINNALIPETKFIRGLESGDVIENWHPQEATPIRQSLDAFSLCTRVGESYHPVYHGVYHFWSDELDTSYYQHQAGMQRYMLDHPIKHMFGPELLVTSGQRPSDYILGDFFESCGYGMRCSVNSENVVMEDDRCYVLFLPRIPDHQAVLDEEAMTEQERVTYSLLLDSSANMIVFGGARDQQFLDAFGLKIIEDSFEPVSWLCGDIGGEWYDHAAVSEAEHMAGKPEKYKRKDYILFESNDAQVLAEASDAQGNKRPLVTRRFNKNGGQRIYVGGIPETATRFIAEEIIAKACNLPYRVKCAHNTTSFMWDDQSGETNLCIMRYGAWHEAESIVELSDLRQYQLSAAYGVKRHAGKLHMDPQSWVLMQKRKRVTE